MEALGSSHTTFILPKCQHILGHTDTNCSAFPEELLLYIFSFLSAQQLVTIKLVNKTVCRLSEDRFLWHHLMKVRWPGEKIISEKSSPALYFKWDKIDRRLLQSPALSKIFFKNFEHPIYRLQISDSCPQYVYAVLCDESVWQIDLLSGTKPLQVSVHCLPKQERHFVSLSKLCPFVKVRAVVDKPQFFQGFSDGSIHSNGEIILGAPQNHYSTMNDFEICLSNQGICIVRAWEDGGLNFKLWANRTSEFTTYFGQGPVSCLHYFRMGDQHWLGCAAGRHVIIYNMFGEGYYILGEHANKVNCLEIVTSCSRPLLISGDEGGSVIYWDLLQKTHLHQYRFEMTINAIKLMRDEQGEKILMVLVSDQYSLEVYDLIH